MCICHCIAHYLKKKTTELLKRLHETGSRPQLELVGWLDPWYPKSSLYDDTQVNLILDWPHDKSWLPLATLALSPNSGVDIEAQAILPSAHLEKTTNIQCLHFPHLKKMEAKQVQLEGQGKLLNLHFPYVKQISWELFEISKTKVRHSFLYLIAWGNCFLAQRCLFSQKQNLGHL